MVCYPTNLMITCHLPFQSNFKKSFCSNVNWQTLIRTSNAPFFSESYSDVDLQFVGCDSGDAYAVELQTDFEVS